MSPRPLSLRDDLPLALLVVSATVGLAFLPVLVGKGALLSGDALTHSLALRSLYAGMLGRGEFVAWNPEDSFGFPIHAESQGGYFHPLNFVAFACLDPLVAHHAMMLFHVLLAGVATALLARILGAGRALGLAAGVMVATSPVLQSWTYNSAYLQTAAYSAVTFLAFEVWDLRRDLRAGLGLAGAITAMVLSGYQQVTYATVLFLGALALVRRALDRDRVVGSLGGLALAVSVGAGLAAVQILPLLELTSRSIRHGPVPVIGMWPLTAWLRGLFVDTDPQLFVGGKYPWPDGVYPALGTVTLLWIVPFLARVRDRRILSYLPCLGVFVLFLTGTESALFRGCYALLPGFDKFRQTAPFTWITIFPTAAVAVAGLEAGLVAAWDRRGKVSFWALAILTAAAAFHLARPLALLPELLRPALAIGLGGVVGGAFLAATGRPGGIPGLFLALLLAETAAYRASYVRSFDPALLGTRSEGIERIRLAQAADPGIRACYHPDADCSWLNVGMGFLSPHSPGYPAVIRDCLEVGCGYSYMLLGLRFFECHNALQLERRMVVEPLLDDEIRGRSKRAAGSRLIDRMRVRHVVGCRTPQVPPSAHDLVKALEGPEGRYWILENPSLGPPVTWHPQVVPCRDLADAVGRLRAGEAGPLVEPPSRDFLPGWARDLAEWVPAGPVAPTLVFDSDRPEPGYAFLPVPDYPGWTASLDGAPVPIFPADVIGSAVAVPAGRHRIELRFIPRTLRLGALLTMATLVGTLVALAVAGRRPRTGD